MTDQGPMYVGPEYPPEPWYRQRGPLVAALVVGAAVAFFLIALLVWWLSSDDGSIATDDATTTSVTTTTTIAEVPVAPTLPPITAPPVTEPPVTEPPVTEPPVTEPPVTEPPVTEPPVTEPPVTQPPAPTTTTTSLPVVTVPPAGDPTVWDIVEGNPDLTRMAELLVAAELDDVLRGDDPFTLFAVADDAWEVFEATPEGAAVVGDPITAVTLLLRHLVFPERYTADQLLALDEVLVATGEFLPIDATARTVDGAELLVTDVAGTNGVLHVVERVLQP